MDKKTMLIVGGIALAVLLIVGGVFAYKKWDESRPNTNAKYTKCVEDANALQEKNNKIVAEVEADIKKCTRDYIKAQGYNDDLECVGTGVTDPICDQEKYDKNGVNIGRYNAEVNGSNKCNETRDAQIKAKGYEEGIPALDCMKYLGEK